jgi:hypothetical protein
VPAIAAVIGCSESTAKRDVAALGAAGKIRFDGAPKTGGYPSTADAPTNPTRTGSPRARASSAASPAMSFLPIAITAAATQLEVLFANGTRVSVPCHDREVIRVVLSSLLAEGPTSAPREDEPC